MTTHRTAHRLLLPLITLLLFLSGCGTYYIDANLPRQPRFHNWWNFYELGTEFLKEGKVREARLYFEICLGIRRGAKFGFDRDMWRARTYGLHFIEGFFPNRELGVCLYQLGETGKAVSFLEKSLSQTPSGRAKFYINRARKELLAGKVVAPPAIEFDAKSRVVWTRQRSRRLSGISAGNAFVRDISINGTARFIELAEKRKPFEESIALREGPNTVSVEARDLLGQATTKEISWVADWHPPELIVKAMRQQGGNWIVDAVCSDDNGITGVTLDGEPRFNAAAGAPLRKRVNVAVQLTAGQRVTMKAVDVAGNELQTVLSPQALRTRIAAVNVLCEVAMAPHADGMTDIAMPILGDIAQAPAEDTTKPTLELKGVTSGNIYVEELNLRGGAKDRGGLAAIQVNGQDVLDAEDRGALTAFFSRRIPLKMGPNSVSISVQDAKGNKLERTLKLVRKKPEYLHDKYRLTIGIPPLLSEEAVQLSRVVKRHMEEELLEQPIRFRFLEHDDGWEPILRKQGISLSDLSDPSTARKLAEAMPVDMFLMSSLMRDGAGITVCARIVETGRGEIMFVEDIYSEAIKTELSRQIEGLVMKIERGFPLIDGRVLETGRGKATVDRGKTHGVRTHCRFLVIEQSKGPAESSPGNVCKSGSDFVELNAYRVADENSSVRVKPKSAGNMVKNGHPVYAR